MIQFNKLTLGYGQRMLLDKVSIRIPESQLIALLGRNGTGKSTLLRAIMGLEKPLNGEILLQNKNVSLLKPEELARNISFVTTDKVRIANLRCEDVVSLGRAPYTNWLGQLQPKDKEQVDEAIRLVGMTDYAEKTMDKMSDGECQRIMIAMALICNPKVLFADEPTTALDVTIQAQIIELMNDLKDKIDTSIVLITHDMGVVANMADRIYVMYAGQIVEHGDCDTIFHHPKHPYTWGLLSSVPRLDKRVSEDLYSIPGTPPDLLAPPVGCAFAARCKYAMNICRTSQPPCIDFSEPDHYASCWLNHPACIKKNGAPKSPVEAQNIKEEE